MTDYINMETKTCFFGYGGIAIYNCFQFLILKSIKPPLGAGTMLIGPDRTKIGNWEYTGSKLSIRFNTLDEVREVCNMLNDIESNNGGSFEFKGIVFDFTTYEQESIIVLRKVMERVRNSIVLSMAC